MSSKDPRSMVPSNGGFLKDVAVRAKLILRLMGDRRVSPVLKALPVLSVAYLIWPLDIMIGPLDDAAIVGLGFYLFMELCPPEVVEEHLRKLRMVPPPDPAGTVTGSKPVDEENIIDGEFHDVDAHKPGDPS